MGDPEHDVRHVALAGNGVLVASEGTSLINRCLTGVAELWRVFLFFFCCILMGFRPVVRAQVREDSRRDSVLAEIDFVCVCVCVCLCVYVCVCVYCGAALCVQLVPVGRVVLLASCCFSHCLFRSVVSPCFSTAYLLLLPLFLGFPQLTSWRLSDGELMRSQQCDPLWYDPPCLAVARYASHEGANDGCGTALVAGRRSSCLFFFLLSPPLLCCLSASPVCVTQRTERAIRL